MTEVTGTVDVITLQANPQTGFCSLSNSHYRVISEGLPFTTQLSGVVIHGIRGSVASRMHLGAHLSTLSC